MSFGVINQLSPGVSFREVDLTTRVPTVSVSIGAMVGLFNWGPVDEIVQVDSSTMLQQVFGKPDELNYKDWFTAENFLGYTNNIKLVRGVTAGAINATDAATATVTVKNYADWQANSAGIISSDATDHFIAKFPGTKGNDFVVEVASSASFVTGFTTTALGQGTYDLTQEFEFAPTANEQAIVVIDTKAVKNGDTFIPTIVEKWILSKDPAAKDFQGNSNFINDVLAIKSRYVYSAYPFTLAGAAISGTYTLSNGVDSDVAGITDAVYTGTNDLTGWGLFLDAETIDINLCLQGGAATSVAQWIDQNVCQTRKDCILFVSPQESDVVNAASVSAAVASMKISRNVMGSTSYSFMDGNYKYQYDRFNDKYRWLPLNGDIGGLAARTDQTNDPWYSPAGFNRGNIKGVVKLAINPRRSFRDTLYSAQLNPVVNFSGQGPILFGDKTLQQKPSAFDRINVRRLFIILEKSISIASKMSLFEFNDAFTRARFVQMVEPFLRDVKGRRGIYDFKVIADTTNNTPQVIDSNNFVGDIYIKPARSINFISLNFTATPTGVAFSEIIG